MCLMTFSAKKLWRKVWSAVATNGRHRSCRRTEQQKSGVALRFPPHSEKFYSAQLAGERQLGGRGNLYILECADEFVRSIKDPY